MEQHAFGGLNSWNGEASYWIWLPESQGKSLGLFITHRWTAGVFLLRVVSFVGRILTPSYVVWIKLFNLVTKLMQESSHVYFRKIKEKGLIMVHILRGLGLSWNKDVTEQNSMCCVGSGSREQKNKGTSMTIWALCHAPSDLLPPIRPTCHPSPPPVSSYESILWLTIAGRLESSWCPSCLLKYEA